MTRRSVEDRAEADVLQAASDLVAAFGEHRADDYFACFAPDATFVFHHVPERLESTSAYRQLWHRWEVDDGFRVLACSSRHGQVQLLGDVAVFTHEVLTEVRSSGAEASLRERETIVFARRDDRWVAVHEHLSPQ